MASVIVPIIIIVSAPLIGLIAWYLIRIVMTGNRLRIRDPMNKKSYVTDYIMTEKKNKKDGVIWWSSVFWQNRLKIPEPPTEVIDFGPRGRKILEVYRLTEDQYAYIKDKGINLPYFQKLLAAKHEHELALQKITANKENSPKIKEIKDILAQIDAEIDQFKEVSTYRPFNIVQRQVIVSQFAKAEEQRQKNFWKESIVPMTAIMALAVIVIMLLVYWGDIAKPALESHRMAQEVQQQNIKLLQQLDSIKGGNSQAIVPEPQQGGGVITKTEDPPLKNE